MSAVNGRRKVNAGGDTVLTILRPLNLVHSIRRDRQRPVTYALYPQPQVQSVFTTVSDDDQLIKLSQGNKSFVAFSNLNDTETLTKTWKVCFRLRSRLNVPNSSSFSTRFAPKSPVTSNRDRDSRT